MQFFQPSQFVTARSLERSTKILISSLNIVSPREVLLDTTNADNPAEKFSLKIEKNFQLSSQKYLLNLEKSWKTCFEQKRSCGQVE